MPRILVVDDQAAIRTMIGIVLRVHGFEIVGAESSVAGLQEFETGQFDLAIVDIFLDGTSGVDLIRRMRDGVPGFPVIAISGMTSLDYFTGSADLSDVVCLRKPFRPTELVAAIETVMDSGGPLQAAAAGVA